uniref:Uncharacterized protein n=1 Tax=Arundo donax TaxID=35708 RepID=A0A0A9FN12_ARUDO
MVTSEANTDALPAVCGGGAVPADSNRLRTAKSPSDGLSASEKERAPAAVTATAMVMAEREGQPPGPEPRTRERESGEQPGGRLGA